MDTLDCIIRKTDNTMAAWKKAAQEAIPPQSAAQKINDAMLDWIGELTRALRIWTDKGERMTSGELILARTNIGALVESWLKLFYCAYNEDYQQNPKTRTNWKTGQNQVIEPNDLSFETLKQYSRGILYELNDDWEVWIDGVQRKRNAIHSFNYREIGTADAFYDDVEKLLDFIELVTDRLPPIEDCIQCYPYGYEPMPFDRIQEKITRVRVF